jgi:alpha-tubulin suppressor-like RCC1 family protein
MELYIGDRTSIATDDRSVAMPVISSPIRPASPGRTNGEWQNLAAFAALKADGSVVAWGSPYHGGDSSAVASQLSSGVSQIFSSPGAFAALKADGSVVTWGSPYFGGDSSAVASQLSSGVSQVFSAGYAFAALKKDGSVVTWGANSNRDESFDHYGVGGGDSSAVASQISSGVSQIFSSLGAFAALKADGSVDTWGSSDFGGDSSAVASQISSGVSQIFSTQGVFAALKADGSVVTWGSPYVGGDSSAVASQLSSGVSQIFSAVDAFAALKTDGSVVTWGSPDFGGDSSAVASQISSGVSQIFSSTGAFAALKSDGSVVTWGTIIGGDSPAVASQLSSGVSQIFSTVTAFAALNAFAALKVDGSLVTWGAKGGDSRAVASQISSGVSQIFSNGYAFAALKEDGSVVAWGDLHVDYDRLLDYDANDYYGFLGSDVKAALLYPALFGYAFFGSNGGNSSAVASQLSSGVSHIFSTSIAFAALKADGSVVTWGNRVMGGDSSTVAGQLNSGVSKIFSTRGAFAALKDDGSVVTWGGLDRGVKSAQAVAGQLRSGVSQIFSNGYAFAALKTDGSVVTWGDIIYDNYNAGGSSYQVSSQLQSDVSQIFSTEAAFAALKNDGSVVTWGWVYAGGDSSAVASQLSSDVSQIFSNRRAFAALKGDGSVVTWGDSGGGGSSYKVSSQLQSGVSQIFSTQAAFAALKADGSVVTWGDSGQGGDSSAVAGQLSSAISQIFSTESAFAALKADGSVVTWGNNGRGGDISAVASQLSSGVSQIFSTEAAFAALKNDGSVVTWGNSGVGGDSSAVASQLRSGVIRIFSTEAAFAALKADGSVVTWGFSEAGGDSRAVASQLRSGVSQIFSNHGAFAALKADGSVVTWSSSGLGGDSRAVASQLSSGVVGFANPFTDDWLVGTASAAISLAVDAALIREDGSGNLVYAFSRTGDTSNALDVYYSIAGTADGADYSGATPGSGKFITFAAGSATATLAIDPTADNTIEADETIAISLIPGDGYTIATTTAIQATIQNDDTSRLSHTQSAAGTDSFSLHASGGSRSRLKISLSALDLKTPYDLAVFSVDDPQGRIHGIEPSDPAYTQAALARAENVFSVINTIPQGFDPLSGSRVLEFDSGAHLRFLLLANDTLDHASQNPAASASILFSSSNHLAIAGPGYDQFSLSWKDGQGQETLKDLVVKIEATDEPITTGANLQDNKQGEVLDLSAVVPAKQVQASFVVNREAGYNNVVGFYPISDRQGTIRDPITGTSLKPGQLGYREAALRNRMATGDLQAANQSTATSLSLLPAGAILAPFILANGLPEHLLDANPANDTPVYFPFLAANHDGVDHIRLLADNTFGFEDLAGGGDLDYNDLIVKTTVTIL